MGMRMGMRMIVTLLGLGLNDVLPIAEDLVDSVNCLSSVVRVLSLQADVFDDRSLSTACIFRDVHDKGVDIGERSQGGDELNVSKGVVVQYKFLRGIQESIIR
jgi:hypothetical protein